MWKDRVRACVRAVRAVRARVCAIVSAFLRSYVRQLGEWKGERGMWC